MIANNSILEELSAVVIVSWSTIHHQAILSSPTISLHKGEWSLVKLSISKEPHSFKWHMIRVIIIVLNVCQPVRFSFVKCAHWKSDFDQWNLIDWFGWIWCNIRMPYCVLNILLELEIRDIQSFKIFVEVKTRMSPFNLLSLGWFLLRLILSLFYCFSLLLL